jgi:hypothetical protein
MSPAAKFVIKCVLIGAYGVLVALQVALPGISLDELVAALIAGAIGGLGYAGIGAATPLEHPGGETK